ncbi:MAG TPA: tetratricopeptide repeat protein [Actinomycetes bacterium]|nr:tetratricopeptide repeat protein [Actinomycetes bacterium]
MTQLPGGYNPYGAVDLGVLAQQKQARERAMQAQADGAADGGAAPVSPVIEVTDVSFEQDVVQRSMIIPVVIDFWATWCEPCKQLSPILERFAEADNGQWVLAKVDVDANPQLSAAAQVQSIPTVMVVWQGQVIPGFAGALPEAQVRDFLNQVIALTGEQAQGDDAEPEGTPVDPALEAADDAMARNDLEAAATAYQAVLAERPGDVDAVQGLAQVELLRRTEGRDLARVLSELDADPNNVSLQLLAADLQLLAGEVEQAFDRLLGVIAEQRNNPEAEASGVDAAKAHLLMLLDLVGNDDERVLAARRSLASALF